MYLILGMVAFVATSGAGAVVTCCCKRATRSVRCRTEAFPGTWRRFLGCGRIRLLIALEPHHERPHPDTSPATCASAGEREPGLGRAHRSPAHRLHPYPGQVADVRVRLGRPG